MSDYPDLPEMITAVTDIVASFEGNESNGLDEEAIKHVASYLLSRDHSVAEITNGDLSLTATIYTLYDFATGE